MYTTTTTNNNNNNNNYMILRISISYFRIKQKNISFFFLLPPLCFSGSLVQVYKNVFIIFNWFWEWHILLEEEL